MAGVTPWWPITAAGDSPPALPHSLTSSCGLGSLPQQEVSTCRLPHFFLFPLFLCSSHPPDRDASRAGGHPALPFRFARGGCKWQRVGSADGRASLQGSLCAVRPDPGSDFLILYPGLYSFSSSISTPTGDNSVSLVRTEELLQSQWLKFHVRAVSDRVENEAP